MKNKKEHVICENEKGRIWRVYKRLCKYMGGCAAKVIDLAISKNGFSFSWTTINKGSFSKKKRLYFKVSKGKIHLTKSYGGGTNKRYTSNYKILEEFLKFKPAINTKINRILNKEFGLKFKIGKSFVHNYISQFSPIYMSLYPKPTFSMVTVMKHSSVKKNIRAYCGFSGKKLISDLLSLSEEQQRHRLDVIRIFKKYLTFGEINVKDIHWAVPVTTFGQPMAKEMLSINSTMFKKTVFVKDSGVVNTNMTQIPFATREIGYIADTISLYTQMSQIMDIENSPLALSKAKKLKDYHDLLSSEHRKLKDAKVNFKQRSFDGTTIGNFTLKVCNDSHELISWSTYMGNCVSGYKTRILTGEIIMCALYDGDTMVYNLSFRKAADDPKKPKQKILIDQLNSRYNRGYKPEDFALVEAFVQEYNDVLFRQKETVGA
jgi:hypothetical protein